MPIIRCRRQGLDPEKGGPPSHVGLLVTRYLRERGEPDPIQQLLSLAASATPPDAYQLALQRWREMLDVRARAGAGHVVRFTWELATPLAVGLGNESVLEVGLTLHHTYGMPLIPGSALKGLCRRAARLLKEAGELSEAEERVLFGAGADARTNHRENGESAGYIVFWDAWYEPRSGDEQPLQRDVITVHHPDYYGKGEWPTDFDDPNPVAFLSVRPGTRFLFALEAPTREWGDYGQKLLQWGLQSLGAGAKTNAGYGYFRPIGQRAAQPAVPPGQRAPSVGPAGGQRPGSRNPASPALQGLQGLIQNFRSQSRSMLPHIVSNIERLPSASDRAMLTAQLIRRIEALGPSFQLRPEEKELIERLRRQSNPEG